MQRGKLVNTGVHACSDSLSSDSLQPHGLQPARLLCPWDFPDKSTGAGCHFLLQGIFSIQGLDNPKPLTGRLLCKHLFSFPSLSGRGSGVQGPPSRGSCSPPHPPFPVRYRVFALDQKMRPATDILTVMVEVSPRPLTFLKGQGC